MPAPPNDLEIARACQMRPITDIAQNFGVSDEYLVPYGKYKAKITPALYEKLADKPNGKLVLVTAINPTPAGEGKTTTTVGLSQALNLAGKKTIAALREPSLGPCMGIKGGAAGGGFAQVVPMEDINLHFTGDLHAITAAHNLLSAMLDNHIHHGNALNIHPAKITWRRVMDMNDRALRQITAGLGGAANGLPREDGFMITVASEVMAILCLAADINDLKQRLGDIIVAANYAGEAVYCRDLNAHGAMAALLKDALMPNLVQTLEHTPAIIHGGPFANIAHGCNSVIATRLALKLADIVVTEAGFGADLGAEKFFDIKCRKAGLSPDAAVLVATVRALKYNGGAAKTALSLEDLPALKAGLPNLQKHIENLSKYGVPVVVALNCFAADTEKEQLMVKEACEEMGAAFALSNVWEKGGAGGADLAARLIKTLDTKKAAFSPLYPDSMPLEQKIETVAREIYGAAGVDFAPRAKTRLKYAAELGLSNLPVCIAKTQYSLSDNPALLGRPQGFKITIRDCAISNGAGFIVAYAGDIMTMPGLPKTPAACGINISADGEISGLF